jgi:hypothetical protein
VVGAAIFWMDQLQREVQSLDLMSKSPLQFLSGNDARRTQTALNVFNTKKAVYLRDSKYRNPQVIEKGAVVTIDPVFLRDVFGTLAPTNEQIEKLLLNPGEASDDIVTHRFTDTYTKRSHADYFFPVVITTKNGEIKKGMLARGSMINADIVDMPYESNDLKALQEQVADHTPEEGGKVCHDCMTRQLPPATVTIKKEAQKSVDIAKVAVTAEGDLFERYKKFAHDFQQSVSKKRLSMHNKKVLFIKALLERFSAKDAGKIVAAITAFGEAPHRDNDQAQMAEVAAILKVIDNRASSAYYNSFYNSSRTLSDAGISNKLDTHLTAALANSQFSVWNDTDNNLKAMLNFDPEKSDKLTYRRLSMAFEAQKKIENNEIEFLGNMASNKLVNYHANYVYPSWAGSLKNVRDPIVRIKTRVNDEEVKVADVNLRNQSGSRHLFYMGNTI